MNIVLLTENWFPRVGGIENYLRQLAEHLPKESVTVIASKTSSEVSEPEYGKGIRQIIYKRFFWPIAKPAWLPLYIWMHRSARREKVDLLLSGKGLFEGLVGYYLKKYLGIPYIVCTYAMEIEVWSRSGGTRRKLQRVLTHADRVVYINDVTKQHLLSLGVAEAQLVKIWPGVHPRFLYSPSADADKAVVRRYSLEPNKYILCVSRLVERKGVDTLIEAFAQLDQTKFSHLKLAIVGTGPELEKLKKCSQQNYVETSVMFLGAVADDDLPALYRNAQFFALTPKDVPDDIEGFGMVYIEAAAAGRPALATRTGGVKEAVLHKETGLLVTPGSVSAIAEGLRYLLEHTDEREQLGRAARERAYKEFRWDKRALLVKGMIDAVLTEQVRKAKV